MFRLHPVAFLLASCTIGTVAQAGTDLIAIGNISGTYEDFATQTSAPLENGVPGNRLGGMGSGLAYAGGNTFLALPDRGPNAVPYNSGLDDTASYIARFQTLNLSLSPSDAGSALPYTLTPFLVDTTLLHSRTPLIYGSGAVQGVAGGVPSLNRRHAFYFTGRSDGFDPSKSSDSPDQARLDPEAIRVSRDGRSVFISDEYGPHIYQFDRFTGDRIRVIPLPAKFAVVNQSSIGNAEISGNISGRVANKGMEGLAITPDGRTLVGILQSPLLQDGGTSGANTRIVSVDLRTGVTHEYAYELANMGSASKPKYTTVSDLLAINDHEFLVDERDGKGLNDNSTATFKRLYHIDLSGAQDVSNLSGAANLVGKGVAKSLFLDVVSVLNAHGVASEDIPAKLEGVAFGPDVTVGGVSKHTLFIANDNDYASLVTDMNHPLGKENPNTIFVFAVDPSDLPSYVPQQFARDGKDWDGWDECRR